MPTQFPRRKCLRCQCKQVAWKMTSIADMLGKKVAFLCWDCSRDLRDSLNALPLDSPVSKKERMAYARAWHARMKARLLGEK